MRFQIVAIIHQDLFPSAHISAQIRVEKTQSEICNKNETENRKIQYRSENILLARSAYEDVFMMKMMRENIFRMRGRLSATNRRVLVSALSQFRPGPSIIRRSGVDGVWSACPLLSVWSFNLINSERAEFIIWLKNFSTQTSALFAYVSAGKYLNLCSLLHGNHFLLRLFITPVGIMFIRSVHLRSLDASPAPVEDSRLERFQLTIFCWIYSLHMDLPHKTRVPPVVWAVRRPRSFEVENNKTRLNHKECRGRRAREGEMQIKLSFQMIIF